MKLLKSKAVQCVPCGDGNYVLFNSILNNPLVLNQQCIEFINRTQYINVDSQAFSEEESGLIEALKESFIFLKEDTDEKTICDIANNDWLKKFTKGQTIKFLDLRVSEKCNFGCTHCISGKAKKNSIMSLETAIEIVDYVIGFLRNAQPEFSKLDVHYGSAEPLLNFSVIKALQDHFKRKYSDIDKVVSINTNLSILSEKMAEFFINEGILIYVSLDGLKEANDSIRVLKNGKGTFDLIMSKMDILKRKGYPIEGISVTITDGNYKYFDLSFIDWCNNQGYKSLAMDFDLVNPLKVSVNERVDLLVSMWKKSKDINMEFFGTWITPFLNLSNRSITNEHYAFCKGIHGQSLSVSSDGIIYICGFSSTPVCHYKDLGNALNKNGEMYNLIKSRLIGKNDMCKGCIIEGSCAGQCQVTQEQSQQKIEDQCSFYRLVTIELLKAQGAMDML